jgi:septum formation protein
MERIILASTSEWRRKLLQNAGIHVQTVGSGVDESLCLEADPAERALVLARWKAEAVISKYPNEVVLGSDQVVWDGRKIIGKPKDRVEHLAMLNSYRGSSHQLYTGISMHYGPLHQAHVVCTRMEVRADLTDLELQAYVDTEEGRYCAGGYAIEGRGGFMFSGIDGDWFNVVGLPLFQVISVLRQWGWRYE